MSHASLASSSSEALLIAPGRKLHTPVGAVGVSASSQCCSQNMHTNNSAIVTAARRPSFAIHLPSRRKNEPSGCVMGWDGIEWVWHGVRMHVIGQYLGSLDADPAITV